MRPMLYDCHIYICFSNSNLHTHCSPLLHKQKIKSTKKHIKRAIERKPLKRETLERRLTTAALKRESSRARDRNRERLAYKLYPTKGISQVQTTLPTILSYYCRYPETDHLQTPCDDCRNQIQGLEKREKLITLLAGRCYPPNRTNKTKTQFPKQNQKLIPPKQYQ